MPFAALFNFLTLGLIVVAGPLAWLCIRVVQARPTPREDVCGQCGYTLAGLKQRIPCPECGDDPRVIDHMHRPLLQGPTGPILAYVLGAAITGLLTCGLAIAIGITSMRPLVAGLVIATLVMPIPLVGVLGDRSAAERCRVIAGAWLAALVFVLIFIPLTRWDTKRDAEGLSGVAASSVSVAGIGAIAATVQWRCSRGRVN